MSSPISHKIDSVLGKRVLTYTLKFNCLKLSKYRETLPEVKQSTVSYEGTVHKVQRRQQKDLLWVSLKYFFHQNGYFLNETLPYGSCNQDFPYFPRTLVPFSQIRNQIVSSAYLCNFHVGILCISIRLSGNVWSWVWAHP